MKLVQVQIENDIHLINLEYLTNIEFGEGHMTLHLASGENYIVFAKISQHRILKALNLKAFPKSDYHEVNRFKKTT